MMKIAAFDLDGTIADTMPMCIEAFCESVSAYTDHELTEKEVVQTFGLNEAGMVKAVVKQDWESALNDFYLNYEQLHEEITEPFPDIVKLLTFLKQKKVILALITGKGERSCTITLRKLGLWNVFDEVLCGSEFSPNKKEHIEYLLEKYAVSKEEFCYIGDAAQDVKSCRDAGVVCYSAAWQEFSNADILEKENPGQVFYRVRDLYEYFRDRC